MRANIHLYLCLILLHLPSRAQEQLANDTAFLMDARREAKDLRKIDKREYVKQVISKLTAEGNVEAPDSFLLDYKKRLENGSDDPTDILLSDEFLTNYAALVDRSVRITAPGLATRDVQKPEFRCCVAIGRESQGKIVYFGTGTLISKRLVLTAAHVINDGPGFVYFGLNTNDTSGAGKRIDVEDVQLFGYEPHPKHKNDIALLLLSDDAPPRVKPALIAPVRACDYMTSIRVVGFGHHGTSARVEQKRLTDIAVFSRSVNEEQANLYRSNPGIEFIAADPHRVRDTCNGDSGGPAFTMFKSDWALVGVTSRATSKHGECGPGGIYVRVANFITELDNYAKSLGEELTLVP